MQALFFFFFFPRTPPAIIITVYMNGGRHLQRIGMRNAGVSPTRGTASHSKKASRSLSRGKKKSTMMNRTEKKRGFYPEALEEKEKLKMHRVLLFFSPAIKEIPNTAYH